MLLYFLYVFLAPFEYIYLKLPTGPAGLNYLNVTLVAMLVAWLWSRLRSGPPFLTPSPLNLPLVAYLVLAFLGLVQACISIPEAGCPFSSDGRILQSYIRIANGVFFFWFATTFVDSRRRARQLFLVLSVSTVFAFRAFYNELSAVRRWHYDHDMRVNGPFVYLGSNEIAAYFAFLGVFLAIVAPAMDRLWHRVALRAAAALCGYAVLYSYSRAAWLAVLIALVVVTALRHRWLAVVMVITLATSPLWLPVSVRDRFDMTTDEAGELESSAASRTEFAEFALGGFGESPIVGHGVGSFRLLSPKGKDTHNLFLRTLFESGIVGFLVLVAVWAGFLYTGAALWLRAEHPLDERVGFALFVAALGLLAGNLFGDRFTYQPLIAQVWTIVGVGARLRAHDTGQEPLLEDSEDLGGEGHEGDDAPGGPG